MLRTMETSTGRARRSLVRTLVEELWDVLLPQRCIACGVLGASLHEACVALLPVANGARCERCWAPGVQSPALAEPPRLCERCAEGGPDAPAFDALRAPFRFEGLARRALLEAKFRGITAHLEPIGHAAAGVVPEDWRPDVVVPVPLGRRRERTRGFNQAREAARAVAEALGVPLRDDLVRRGRETAAQATLDAATRRLNLRGAFEVTGTPPPRVLVVDDVTTTGQTLSEVASALRAAGASTVYALAMARED